jgi:hypothetical protein
MRPFTLTAGTVFVIVALAQLARLLTALPVQLGSFAVPLWMSVIPLAGAGSLGAWAFVLAARSRNA